MRRSAVLLIAATLSLTAAACSSSSSSSSPSNSGAGSAGKVTISIDCAPPTSRPTQRQQWADDIAAFEKLHPNVTVKSIDTFPCETPELFTAALKGGTEPNLFYTYFTDRQQVLDAGRAADITSYVTGQNLPVKDDILPSVWGPLQSGGKTYGLPRTNYTMGMIINRKLFQQAGLNPDQPPQSWADVEADAKKIAALGNGIAGYGDYSAGNNGGWHFTAEMYAQGGTMVSSDGTKAAFDNAQGLAVLQNLHKLRFDDNVMGATQLYKWGDLQKQMAAGKLGMYIAAPDDITYMVQSLGAHYEDFGMGPIPGQNGPGVGSLAGGDDYMFNAKDTPAQITAGIQLLSYLWLTEGQGQQYDYARSKASGQAVGLPEPQLFQGATAAKDAQLKAADATMPVQAFAPFVAADVPGVTEPANAQAIYKILDNAMASALTDPKADLQKLLDTAAAQVDEVLANAQ
ncbi:ABC-type glycerol-3-phosphate transport system substrate-binding protein [Kitasatospora sp. MAP12-15]|uniref:extracellular solute-binding protein n=1 Tax=unclassified Kitasatospora TaxID=2633591 RepID=UPI002473917E|nr:extracellular solute-binding protein [Kitasatospora sp. MAP12-44]MDH6115226.1 ABC-type glycerol-3-phosphate transport system substrate-binding protein [Kitasatospora sp. MAP12-44]